ncbi:MAG: response regulator, partial [Candidatus Symbiothrix sp.]|nr:response regulator [Candidatus Symbiothrix sp.]
QSFKIFKRQPDKAFSIGNNFIHCLKEDSQNRFLVGTKQGLFRFDRDTEKFYPIDLGIRKGKEEEVSVNAIYEDPNGQIWLTCHGQGIYVLNPDLSIKKHYTANGKPNAIPSNFIWTIAQDYTGQFWLGSVGAGLIRFDLKKEIFTRVDKHSDLGITDQTVFSLYCDCNNNLWIGTASQGLYRYNYRTGKVTNYMNREALNIKSIIEYSETELIMGSDKGLVLFNRISEQYTFLNNDADNLTDTSIFSIVRDNEGSFWIGTYFGGVNYFSPAINKFHYTYNTPARSVKKNIISCFAEDENGKIWIGTYNDGLSLFNPQTNAFETIRYHIGYHNIQDLLLDGHHLYISLYGMSVSVLNLKTGSVSPLTNDSVGRCLRSVNTIFKRSDGLFFFGLENDGILTWNPKSKTFNKLKPLSGMPIKDICEDYNGNVWIATHANGLWRLNLEGQMKSFTYHPNDPAALPTNNINCVFEDSKFRIWIGAESEGLLLYNETDGRFESVLNEAGGLPSNIIYSILDDNENNIWVATGGGLIKFNPDTKNIKTFGFIGDIQKIRYNPKGALRTGSNHIYFGGTNGFIHFNPKEIVNNEQIPPIEITGLQIAYREVFSNKNSQKITLKYSQSAFGFDFVALSYLSPKHNQYAYRLEGFENEWHFGNEPHASYMNIPAGEYVFRVKGTNNDGVWNDDGASIRIRVKPPFWFASWMILIYITLTAVGLFYAVRNYKHRIEARNQEDLFKYKTRKEKEIYEAKINFFTNIAHEIRTPLSLIIAPLENIMLSGDGNRETKNNLQIIQTNTNRLLVLINQLLDFRKMEENMFRFKFKKCDVPKIVRDVYNQYAPSAKINRIEMTVSEDAGIEKCVVDKEAVYKIVSNLASNAVKFAKEKINIRIELKGNDLLISVEDDGPGLDKKYIDKIFEPFFQIQNKENGMKTGSGLGLSLSQSLAAKHNGRIEVESTPGNGAKFTFVLPVVSELIEQESEPAVEPVEKTTGMHDESGLKILIVEDNSDLRAFITSNLNDKNTVLEAQNGLQALELVEKETIDIIISDIMMPEMDGLELCNVLKTNPAYSHLPLVLLSAKTDTPTKIDGLNKGADVYMEKPFSMEQLKAQIHTIIDNRNKLRENFIQSPLSYFMHPKIENDENAEFIEKLNKNIL